MSSLYSLALKNDVVSITEGVRIHIKLDTCSSVITYFITARMY